MLPWKQGRLLSVAGVVLQARGIWVWGGGRVDKDRDNKERSKEEREGEFG